jgi:hypothetical protein
MVKWVCVSDLKRSLREQLQDLWNLQISRVISSGDAARSVAKNGAARLLIPD